MGLFVSKKEKQLRWDMEIRKAVKKMDNQVKKQDRHIKDFTKKAVRAKRIGSEPHYQFCRKAIRKTMVVRNQLETQKLNLEIATQIKEQANSQKDFINAMGMVARSIKDSLKGVNMDRVNTQFETAIDQTNNYAERLDLFLDSASEAMLGEENQGTGGMVSDDEIDRMIDAEVRHGEKTDADLFDDDLERIQRELDSKDR